MGLTIVGAGFFMPKTMPGCANGWFGRCCPLRSMESEKLAEQALNNTKEQFANSPGLADEIVTAVMGALSAHTEMRKQALAACRT
jgi:hypothetical protein